MVELEAKSAREFRIVHLRGDVDLYSAPRYQEAILQVIGEGEDHIAVHLDEVRHMDSSGLGMLIGVYRRLERVGGRLVVVCSIARLLKLFQVTGLEKVFEIVADEAHVRGESPPA